VPPAAIPICALDVKGINKSRIKNIFLKKIIGLVLSLLNENVLNVVSF
jgi:hypothetical protein